MSFVSEFALGEFISSAGVVPGGEGFQAEGQSALSFAGSFAVPGRFDAACVNTLVFDSFREVYSTYSAQGATALLFTEIPVAETGFSIEGQSVGEFLSFWSYTSTAQIQGDTQVLFASGIEKPTEFGINSGTAANFNSRWFYLADFAADSTADASWASASGFASRFSAQGATSLSLVSCSGICLSAFSIESKSTFRVQGLPNTTTSGIVLSRSAEPRHIIRPRETRATAWRPE